MGRAKTASGLRRAFSPAFFGLVLFIPWRVGAEESGAAKYGFGRRDAARPARAAWAVQRLLAARWRGRRRRRRRFRFIDFRGRVNPFPFFHAREGADGQAVVCPLLRGSSPTRGVAPQQHRDPALTSFPHLNAREGADGQAVVCPLLRGSSPTRGVAPQQHRDPALTSFPHLNAREGADGQAVV